MPKYDWDLISLSMTNEDAQMLLATFKGHKIRGSQKVTCNICKVAKAHKMRERRYVCTSGACDVATPGVDCPWHGKALFCEVLDVVSLFERGQHVTVARSPKRKASMTPAFKEYAMELRKLLVFDFRCAVDSISMNRACLR